MMKGRKRSVLWTVFALVVAILALTASGCGGEDAGGSRRQTATTEASNLVGRRNGFETCCQMGRNRE